MSLSETDLNDLASARTSTELVSAHRKLVTQVRHDRRRVQRELGPLAQTYVAAMQQWDSEKAEGVPKAERLARLEKILRAAWPQTREWKYLCTHCGDYGLIPHTCPGDATCGRHDPHLTHDYGVPCWCSYGAKFKPKAKPVPEDFTAAGKKKAAGLTRIGRG